MRAAAQRVPHLLQALKQRMDAAGPLEDAAPFGALPLMPSPRYLTRAWCTQDAGVKCSVPFLLLHAAEVNALSDRMSEANRLLPVSLGRDSFAMDGKHVIAKAFAPSGRADPLLKQARALLLREDCKGLVFFGEPSAGNLTQWKALSLLHYLSNQVIDTKKRKTGEPKVDFIFFPAQLEAPGEDRPSRGRLEEIATALASFSHLLAHDAALSATRIPDFKHPVWATVRLEEGTGAEDVGDRLPWHRHEKRGQYIYGTLSREGRLLRAVEHRRHGAKGQLRASRHLFCVPTRSGASVGEMLDTPTVLLEALPLSWKLFQDAPHLRGAEAEAPHASVGRLEPKTTSVAEEDFARGAAASAREVVHALRMQADQVESRRAVSVFLGSLESQLRLLPRDAHAPRAPSGPEASKKEEEEEGIRWWEQRTEFCARAAEVIARVLYSQMQTRYWPELRAQT